MGDFDRLRDASRDRLLERPRTRALIAPKKSDAARDVVDVGDAGDVGGDICSVDDCESTVFVRIGATGWKFDCEAMMCITGLVVIYRLICLQENFGYRARADGRWSAQIPSPMHESIPAGHISPCGSISIAQLNTYTIGSHSPCLHSQ